MPRSRAPIPVRSGRTEFLKINAARQDWRDGYHWVLSLTWPQFALFLASSYVALNLFFATFYAIGDGIADLTPHSFPQAFFFSVETLATVGYGHNYPATLYGHVIVTLEIFIGMIWLAVITGLIFVRFSRPTARILFSKNILIGNHDGRPSVMFRVANLRHTSMVDAKFRLSFSRDEKVKEGEEIRRFYSLKVYPEHMPRFPAALTIRHTIDEQSPLHGQTAESLANSDAFLIASVTSIETVMAAAIQSQEDYSYDEIRWGERFVDIYEELEDGRLQVDYGRIHHTEPVPATPM
ncbi:MAG: inward rectifier potassium channel [Verrucomicrobiota bacterium]|jgi:inward rectifier potassium channel